MHNRMGACKTGIGHMKEDPLPRKKVSHKKMSTQPCQPFNLFLRIKAVKQTRGYSLWGISSCYIWDLSFIQAETRIKK
jgi:hypothetical protein